MAYSKQTWIDYPASDATLITADKLSHMEDGIANADTSASTAQTRADNAYSLAETAKTKADNAFSSISTESGNALVKKTDGLYVPQSGGTGGTTVVANPEGSATQTLNKIKIDNVIYGVEGGGSGGITREEVQEMIDDAIGTVLEGSY